MAGTPAGPLARVVALKRLRAGGGADDLARLRREATLLTELDHPHVVRVFEVIHDGDGVALAVQYAPGGSLADLLAERGRLAPGEVVAVAAPIAEALASAHRRGVVHGDVKPANVLFMPVLIAFLFLVVASGRLTDARSDVVSAASDAARAASLQASQGAAAAQARNIAEDTLAGEGITCQGGPDVDLVIMGAPAFQRGATVRVEVGCDVPAGDLALLALPGVITVREEAWEPIDTHRSL